MSVRISRTSLLFALLGGSLFVFLALPIVNIFLEEFTFRFSSLANATTDPVTLKAVGLSLFAAFLAVLIAFGFGVPLAYLLARENFRGEGVVEGIIDLPMAVPHTVAGVALLAVLGSHGLIGGATEPFLEFESALPGIVAAMLFVSAPFMINSAREGFESIDPHLENVARNLGASEWQAFRKVAFPLAFPHIFSGGVMCWARSVSEFSAVILLVGFFPMIAPGLIWSKFFSTGSVEAAMGVGALLLLIVLPTFITLRRLRGELLDKR